MMLSAETLGHLFWGYAIIWICIFLYVIIVRIDQRRQFAALKSLEAELSKLGTSGTS